MHAFEDSSYSWILGSKNHHATWKAPTLSSIRGANGIGNRSKLSCVPICCSPTSPTSKIGIYGPPDYLPDHYRCVFCIEANTYPSAITNDRKRRKPPASALREAGSIIEFLSSLWPNGAAPWLSSLDGLMLAPRRVF